MHWFFQMFLLLIVIVAISYVFNMVAIVKDVDAAAFAMLVTLTCGAASIELDELALNKRTRNAVICLALVNLAISIWMVM